MARTTTRTRVLNSTPIPAGVLLAANLTGLDADELAIVQRIEASYVRAIRAHRKAEWRLRRRIVGPEVEREAYRALVEAEGLWLDAGLGAAGPIRDRIRL